MPSAGCFEFLEIGDFRRVNHNCTAANMRLAARVIINRRVSHDTAGQVVALLIVLARLGVAVVPRVLVERC